MFSRLFRPWWSPVLVAAALAVAGTAARWQLNRAAEKETLFAAFAAGDTGSALTELPPDGAAGELRYRRVSVSGRYDAGRQILLDNIPADGRPGYHVLTPLRLVDGSAVLVNRGWVPADGDRSRLPDVALAATDVTISGRIDRLPQPSVRLAAPPGPASAPWPRRLFFPDAAAASAELGYRVRDYQLLLDPAAPDGFRRDWSPAEFGPEHHLGYAVQWAGLGLTAVVLWVVLSLRRRAPSP
jgi:surfeit locus 1 family protein